jgi:hypothetical protein
MIRQRESWVFEKKAGPNQNRRTGEFPPNGQVPAKPVFAASPDMNARPVDNPLRVDVLRHGAESVAPIAV